MKRTVLILFAIGLVSVGLSHEFWIAPSQYRCQPSQQILLSFLVGEDFHGEVWEARVKRTQSVQVFGAKTQLSLTEIALKSDSIPIPVVLENPGTYLVAMRSNNSFIELEAEKFNDYLKEDGIENIAQLRADKKELDKPAREFYQRCAKTLLQVGGTMDGSYKKNLGQPLEIIPLKNPYALKANEGLPVQILFKGKPLPNAVVRTWHKTPNTETAKGSIRTNAKGIITTPALAAGEWMISLVRMVPHPDPKEADYQSYWASLTFEK